MRTAPTSPSVLLGGVPTAYSMQGSELVVAMNGVQPSGAIVEIDVGFESAVPSSSDFVTGAGVFLGIDEAGLWSVNEPDGTSTWLPVNDHPSDKATWTFEITVPAGVEAIANGALVSSTDSGDDDDLGVGPDRADGHVPRDAAGRPVRHRRPRDVDVRGADAKCGAGVARHSSSTRTRR